MCCNCKDDDNMMLIYCLYNLLLIVLELKYLMPIHTYVCIRLSFMNFIIILIIVLLLNYYIFLLHMLPLSLSINQNQNRLHHFCIVGKMDYLWKIYQICYDVIIFIVKYSYCVFKLIVLLYWRLQRIIFLYQHRIIHKCIFKILIQNY